MRFNMSKSKVLILIFVFSVVLKTETKTLSSRESCTQDNCIAPDCRCASTDVPGNLALSEVPQMVIFTFDDGVNAQNFEYYRQAFFNKSNPNGCPLSATYFTSHEYTDYTKIHDLHAAGHEIALHSITHTTSTDYWRDISIDLAHQEFGGERDLIAHFAKIPAEDINGLRVPFLQLSGNTSYQAIKDLNLLYDSTWPTLRYMDPGLWPYTLDYPSMQDCPIGPCPTTTIPGVWVFPMIDWKDTNGRECAMVDACQNIPEDVDGLLEFMKMNFVRQYNGNRAPFGFYVHSSWFNLDSRRFDAYLQFIDYLQGLNDVYIVSVKKALDWVRSPEPLSNLESSWYQCQETVTTDCYPLTCKLQKGDEERYMTICGDSCPNVYPWLGNPLGQ